MRFNKNKFANKGVVMISSVSSLNFNTNYRPAFSAQENAPQTVKADNIKKKKIRIKKIVFY